MASRNSKKTFICSEIESHSALAPKSFQASDRQPECSGDRINDVLEGIVV